MHFSTVFAILLSGLTMSVADNIVVTEGEDAYGGGTFEVCFTEGHGYKFCTGVLSGAWETSVQSPASVGTGYYVSIKDGVVYTTSDNGCNYHAHCALDWNDDTGDSRCELITDSPNC
ncbi:hypothetical protein K505DRAFT_374763 [Melanomma pulvis-pyrius CBS 109.77]|uniref:Uncharacterized protein n=1 Tax=Melanomma pulvis-pyrius CBS 109.77 TaxID=1314802 RepID=A0A6A6XCU8_9PLEO|nr:hypothetical protein K505DRAFT_374763 [Melanomma pulvis-pyrius CBS 109.77]